MATELTPQQRISEALEAVRADWPLICTNPKLTFDKERDWAIEACTKSSYAINMATGNIKAAQQALRNVGAIGCSLDPAQKLAYILPRDNKMVYDLSYMGLIDIARQAGSILWAQARRVYANETYEPQGYDRPPVHRRKPFAKAEERGEVLGAYVVVKTPDGDYLTDEMNLDEINGIRARSQSYKEYVATKDGQNPKKSPWVSDEAEMQKKTVVKHAYKYWPRSERLDNAIQYLNTDGGQGIDLTAEDESATRLKIWSERLEACTTGEQVAQLWKDAREEFKAAQDLIGYEKLKVEVAAKNRALGVAPPPPPPAGTPAPTAAPTPAPTTAPPPPAAPAARGAAAPTPTPAPPSREAVILADIEKAEDYDTLNAIGSRIDESPADLQAELNDAWNLRLAALKKKLGHA